VVLAEAVKPRGDRGLLLIAIFKLLKALLLVAGGLAVLKLLQPDAVRAVNGNTSR
jgi:uncharacterized sodium:solute symporter family permease YidK